MSALHTTPDELRRAAQRLSRDEPVTVDGVTLHPVTMPDTGTIAFGPTRVHGDDRHKDTCTTAHLTVGGAVFELTLTTTVEYDIYGGSSAPDEEFSVRLVSGRGSEDIVRDEWGDGLREAISEGPPAVVYSAETTTLIAAAAEAKRREELAWADRLAQGVPINHFEDSWGIDFPEQTP